MPYSKYLTSNYAAPDSEFPAIREIVSQLQEKLNAIDTIIARVETMLSQFREKREHVASSIKTHEGFMSCVRRLPHDILKEIFLRCLPSKHHLTPDGQDAPLLLTRICSSWREVALSVGRLWCSLSIRDVYHTEELNDLYREHWLKNARLCPLSLEVCLSPRTIGFLQLYTPRCTELSVSFGPGMSGLVHQLLDEIPLLERLSLTGRMDPQDILQQISIVQPDPRLHMLILHSYGSARDLFPIFDPGWTNLTHLALLSRLGQRDLDLMPSTLLPMCPNLEQLVLSSFLVRRSPNPVSSTHAKLRVLSIARLHDYNNDPHLDKLLLPSLCCLQVANNLGRVTPAFEDVFIPVQPLPDTSPHRTLEVTGIVKCDVSTLTLFTIFKPGWTEITHLKLDCLYAGDFLLVLRLCPRLEHLAVSQIIVAKHDTSHVIHPALRSLSADIEGHAGILLDLLTLPSLRRLELHLLMCSEWPHEKFKGFLSRSQCPLKTLKLDGIDIGFGRGVREELISLIPTLTSLKLRG